MSFYDDPNNVEEYIGMAAGYDGRELIERLHEHLPDGASVLEIGMGPGVDLDLLGARYVVTGSDRSSLFLDRYRTAHPEADLLQLDAVSLATTRRFQAIYSNKVLHHLTQGELQQSLARQLDLLYDGGLALHSFWAGDTEEEFHGLRFVYYTIATLTPLIPQQFAIVEVAYYSEMESDDSLCLLLRKRGIGEETG